MLALRTRSDRAAHWAGILLALPVLLATAAAIVSWLRGELPTTVTNETAGLVFVLSLLIAAGIYLVCRVIGWLVAIVIAASRRNSTRKK